METKEFNKSRYRIEIIKRTTFFLNQGYYLRIVSNANGQVIMTSEKYSKLSHTKEMASALRDELQDAVIVTKL